MVEEREPEIRAGPTGSEGRSGEAQAAFDALRAAIATVGRFAPTMRDPAAEPLARPPQRQRRVAARLIL